MSYIVVLSLNGKNICTSVSKNILHTYESQTNLKQNIRQSIAESIANAIPIDSILDAINKDVL